MIAQYSTVVCRREEKLSYFKVDNHFPLFLRCLNQLRELGNHYTISWEVTVLPRCRQKDILPSKVHKITLNNTKLP